MFKNFATARVQNFRDADAQIEYETGGKSKKHVKATNHSPPKNVSNREIRSRVERKKKRSKPYQKRMWRATAKSYLRRNPKCARCSDPAKHVDHIKPISEGGSMYDWANLQGLCVSCHCLKTREDQRKKNNNIYGTDGYAVDYK